MTVLAASARLGTDLRVSELQFLLRSRWRTLRALSCSDPKSGPALAVFLSSAAASLVVLLESDKVAEARARGQTSNRLERQRNYSRISPSARVT
jgi:hypothetical protein